MAQAKRAAAKATTRATMDQQMLEIIGRGTRPQRYRTSVGQFIRNPAGRQIRLQGADNRLTTEGRAYWRLLGVPPPNLYNYDQPLRQDQFVTAYDGSSIKVRTPTADNGWRVTPAGEGYFRYNRTEYLFGVPYMLWKQSRLVQPTGPRLTEWYVPMKDQFDSGMSPEAVQPIPTRVANIRQTRERGRSLLATDGQRVAEARETALAILRDPEANQEDERSVPYTREDFGGATYTVLGMSSDVVYLWDESRPLVVSSQRTNFWDDRRPTTETILGRPLRNWALPDGMWRPFDLHPDTFKTYEHGCAVQMLFKSFTKRPGGNQRKNGMSEPVPILTIPQIKACLDECFVELGYKANEEPFTHGWQFDGVNGQMIVAFCRQQTSRGRPLKCHVMHGGRKILEYSPDEATDQTPVVTLQIHGNHAYFYQRGQANRDASNMHATKGRQARISFLSDR